MLRAHSVSQSVDKTLQGGVVGSEEPAKLQGRRNSSLKLLTTASTSLPQSVDKTLQAGLIKSEEPVKLQFGRDSGLKLLTAASTTAPKPTAESVQAACLQRTMSSCLPDTAQELRSEVAECTFGICCQWQNGGWPCYG